MTESLEQELDHLDAARRTAALASLWRQAVEGLIALPEPGTSVNLHARSVLQRQSGPGHLSQWAAGIFPTTAAKNESFERLGRELTPAKEDQLRGLATTAAPNHILAKIR
jgi:hypothetical protein